jgi:hypothetical protein
VKVFKFLYADRASSRVAHTAMLHRQARDIRSSVGRNPRTAECIARDHNETQAGNR